MLASPGTICRHLQLISHRGHPMNSLIVREYDPRLKPTHVIDKDGPSVELQWHATRDEPHEVNVVREVLLKRPDRDKLATWHLNLSR